MNKALGTTSSSTLSNQPSGDQRVENVEDYVREAIDLFLRDPADSDFQRGYFCALVNVALEGLELPIEGNLDVAHQQTLRMAVTPQQLREQRDELLAALKAIVVSDQDYGFYCSPYVQAKARAAIASVEGQP